MLKGRLIREAVRLWTGFNNAWQQVLVMSAIRFLGHTAKTRTNSHPLL